MDGKLALTIFICVCAAIPVVAQTTAPEGMSLIPASDYWMGRIHFFLPDAFGFVLRDRLDDFPAHRVDLAAFHIDKYEVTNEQYARFLESTSGRKPWHWSHGQIPKGEERFPVFNVNWEEANAYCKWVGKRLPTEAEWEKASRGGLDRKKFPWGDSTLDIGGGYEVEAKSPSGREKKPANVGNPKGPMPVGSFRPTGYDLYDMAGNVAEWTNDWYDKGYYATSPKRNPHGPEAGLYKVIRGGSWSDGEERVFMNHFRNFTDPELRSSSLGFRCAYSPPS